MIVVVGSEMSDVAHVMPQLRALDEYPPVTYVEWCPATGVLRTHEVKSRYTTHWDGYPWRTFATLVARFSAAAGESVEVVRSHFDTEADAASALLEREGA